MAMAAELHGSNASAQSSASRIVRVGVMRDMAAAEKIWRTFEGTDFLSTPYQRFELLDVWQKTIGKDEGAAPFVVAAYDVDNQPLALLPLAISRENGANVARFMGGKHPTFNMGLWRRDFAETFSAADMDALIAGIRTLPDRVDVLASHSNPNNGAAFRIRWSCRARSHRPTLAL
jgi:CelD/BcsL family acetyltransferase involved in cellulose biosynthesis